MSDFLTACRFLTIIPLGKGGPAAPEGVAPSMAYFPLVGAWLGVILWALDHVFMRIFPGPVSAALIVGFLALVTGGLHLDGFADTIDGIFGGRGDRKRILEIMKDSRAGAIGVAGLVVLIIAKFAAVSGLAGPGRGEALILMPALARWSQVEMAFGTKAARAEGSLAGPFIEHLKLSHFVAATLGAAVIAYLISGYRGLGALTAAGALTLCARFYFDRRIGGITGDTIGAVSEINELLVLLIFLAVK